MEKEQAKLFSRRTWIFLLAVVLLSFFTYFFGYQEPQLSLWDEGYHIASAQKYLNGVYFQEQHPPLGKLLIALGEKIFFPQGQQKNYDSKYIGTDQGSDFPKDFSFAGYRFFPVLLAWLAAPLLFLIFLLIARNPFFAAGLSSLYVFDNALVVHLRAAMLEGPLLFFALLTVLIFLLLLEYGKKKKYIFIVLCLLFGMSFALVAATKVLGLVLILLVPAYLATLFPDWKKMLLVLGLFLIGFLAVYCTVWQVHFALGKRVESALSNGGYYEASAEYKKILSARTSGNFINFPIMLRDSLNFVGHYNNGVPGLKLGSKNENGSPWFLWPFGARSIRYRWDQVGERYAYAYLQPNPVVWLGALCMLFIGFSLIIASWFYNIALKNRFLLYVFLGIYASYIIAVSQITRVLYLYSYFTALIISFVVFALVFAELDHLGKLKIGDKAKKISLSVFACLVFVSFVFFSPLTYHRPLSDEDFNKRNLIPIWGLTCVHCDATNMLGRPFPSE